MNWADLENKAETQKILSYWQRLGQFRARHMAVGAGVHQQLASEPYTFSRELIGQDKDHKVDDRVVIAVLSDADLKSADQGLTIVTGEVFAEGTLLQDAFTGQKVPVSQGAVYLTQFEDVVLLEQAR